MNSYYLIILLGLVAQFSCSRMEVANREESMRFSVTKPLAELEAEFPQEIVEQTIERLEEKPFGDELQFGQCKVTTDNYVSFLKGLLQNPDQEVSLYEVYGKEDWGEILLTSYFSPIYEAREKPVGEFIQPIYGIPHDLVEVKMGAFSQDDLINQEIKRQVVAGRITKGPGALQRIIPFYSRKEIDQLGALRKRDLEIAYMKPIDAFVLQIQGSGKIVFPNGEEVELGYGAQNGHRYFSIGKALLDKIPKEEMSLQKIKDYLKTLNQEELYGFLSLNPSYVFFKKMKAKKGLTTFGIEPVARKTIAVDFRLFPLGSMALLVYPHPSFEEGQEVSFQEKQEYVFAHDTGGAIKGAGRADLYWGSGEGAERAAGVMRHSAQLFFIAPKECSVF